MTLASPDVQTPFVLTESRAFTELYDHEIPPPTSSILPVKGEEKKSWVSGSFFFIPLPVEGVGVVRGCGVVSFFPVSSCTTYA